MLEVEKLHLCSNICVLKKLPYRRLRFTSHPASVLEKICHKLKVGFQVGGFNPFEQISQIGSSPGRDENKTVFETTTYL